MNRAEHSTSTYRAERGQEPVHLDLIPPGDVQQAEPASGPPRCHSDSRPAAQPPGVSWIILDDQEGNEFCNLDDFALRNPIWAAISAACLLG